jgi:hypothetical protein
MKWWMVFLCIVGASLLWPIAEPGLWAGDGVRRYPTVKEKIEVRLIVRELERISKDSVTLDEFGQRTLKQSQEVLQIGAPAVYSLSLCLNNKDWRVRFWIADILGYLNNPDARRPLLRLLDNNTERQAVRKRAIVSIKMLQRLCGNKRESYLLR